jgi:hypothetical protein
VNKYEILGIIGTVLIMIGFMSHNERVIRLFDMAGAAFFVLYGAFTNTYSTLALNALLILVNYIKLYGVSKEA